MSRVHVQIMNQFHRKSHEYKAIKRYWKLIQQDSRKLSDKRFYRPTFRMHLTNKEILNKLLSYSEDLKHHYHSISSYFFTSRIRNQRNFSNLLRTILSRFILFFRLSLKPSSKIKKRLSTPFNYTILMPNWKRPIISSNLSSAMPLDFGTLKTSKNGFSSLWTSKKKGQNLSFLELSFSSTHYSWQRAKKESYKLSLKRRIRDSNPCASYPT